MVTACLDRHQGYAPEGGVCQAPAGEVRSGMVTLWPKRHGTDGFFFAKLRRRGEDPCPPQNTD